MSSTEFKDFSFPMVTEEGMENIKLSEKAEGKNLLIAFFPAAYAPYCIQEMESLNKEYTQYKEHNTEVIGISGDLPWALAKFKADHKIPFPLVSDNKFEAAKAYNTYLENPMGNGMDFSNRGVFLIKDGKVAYEWRGEDPTKQPNFEEIRKHL